MFYGIQYSGFLLNIEARKQKKKMSSSSDVEMMSSSYSSDTKSKNVKLVDHILSYILIFSILIFITGVIIFTSIMLYLSKYKNGLVNLEIYLNGTESIIILSELKYMETKTWKCIGYCTNDCPKANPAIAFCTCGGTQQYALSVCKPTCKDMCRREGCSDVGHVSCV